MSDFATWKAPVWNKDYGDPEQELSLLKKYIQNIHSELPEIIFGLDCFEEGYMEVQLYRKDELWGYLNVVDVELKRVDLFIKEEEEYFLKESDAVAYLRNST